MADHVIGIADRVQLFFAEWNASVGIVQGLWAFHTFADTDVGTLAAALIIVAYIEIKCVLSIQPIPNTPFLSNQTWPFEIFVKWFRTQMEK